MKNKTRSTTLFALHFFSAGVLDLEIKTYKRQQGIFILLSNAVPSNNNIRNGGQEVEKEVGQDDGGTANNLFRTNEIRGRGETKTKRRNVVQILEGAR